MITLHVYLAPKPGQYEALKSKINNPWISTMSEQPGFVQAALLTQFDDESSEDIEVISYWESEALRLDWVALPVHDEVFSSIIDLAETISPTVKTVSNTWSI
tara:strand:+ start:122 stop:427 length:306 start_codon:yes stop_codon:yes gene_type:complete